MGLEIGPGHEYTGWAAHLPTPLPGELSLRVLAPVPARPPWSVPRSGGAASQTPPAGGQGVVFQLRSQGEAAVAQWS